MDMTKKQILVEIARKFINGLPTDVARQTPESVQHHFHLTDNKLGDVFLSSQQSKKFYDFYILLSVNCHQTGTRKAYLIFANMR